MAVLEHLAATRDGAGVTELARDLELDKGYLHRLLRTLESIGYVEQDQATKVFRPTVKFIALSGAILKNLDVLDAGRPVMRGLLEATGEAVHFARRIKTGGVYVAQERPPARISVETELGSQPELHCTATGKALLAFLEPAELRELVREPFPQYTHRTIASLADLERDLAAVRARGYGVDDEERNPEVRCVAAPVFDLVGKPVGCIGLSGPTSRVTIDRVPVLGALVLGAAEEITLRIGGSMPAGLASQDRGPMADGSPARPAALAAAAVQADPALAIGGDD